MKTGVTRMIHGKVCPSMTPPKIVAFHRNRLREKTYAAITDTNVEIRTAHRLMARLLPTWTPNPDANSRR